MSAVVISAGLQLGLFFKAGGVRRDARFCSSWLTVHLELLPWLLLHHLWQ